MLIVLLILIAVNYLMAALFMGAEGAVAFVLFINLIPATIIVMTIWSKIKDISARLDSLPNMPPRPDILAEEEKAAAEAAEKAVGDDEAKDK